MFGVGFSYPSSGGLPLLPVKSICLATNTMTFGSEGRGPSRNPRVCLSEPRGGSASSTPARLSASSCSSTGNSSVSQIPVPWGTLPREQLAWHAAGKETSLAAAKPWVSWKELLETMETAAACGAGAQASSGALMRRHPAELPVKPQAVASCRDVHPFSCLGGGSWSLAPCA